MCQIKRESGMRRGYNVRALFQISKYPNAQYCIHQSMKLKTNERKYQMCVRVSGVACAHALHAYWIRKKRNKYRLTTNIGEYSIHKKLNQQKLICSIYIHLTSITYINIWLKNECIFRWGMDENLVFKSLFEETQNNIADRESVLSTYVEKP